MAHERMKKKRDDMERQENKDRLGWNHHNGVGKQPRDQTCTCVGRPLGWMTAASRSSVVGPGALSDAVLKVKGVEGGKEEGILMKGKRGKVSVLSSSHVKINHM